MKEKWELFKVTLQETKSMTKKEFLLITSVCILGGMVVGMLISPRKSMVIGSHNGNNNGSNNQDNNNNNSGSVSADIEEAQDEEIVSFN